MTQKVISATLTLSSRGGGHFSSDLPLPSWYQKWLQRLIWKEKKREDDIVYEDNIKHVHVQQNTRSYMSS